METRKRCNLTKASKPAKLASAVKIIRFLPMTSQLYGYYYNSDKFILFSEHTCHKIHTIAKNRMSRAAMADRVRVAPTDEGLDIRTV